MKIKTFEIIFDNQYGVYENGKQIAGKVLLDLEKPVKLRSLKLFFIGKSKTFWITRFGKGNVIEYGNEEMYMNHVLTFIESDDGSNIEHPAGSHVFPFILNLPDHCPSSFEGSKGYVRYFCKATLDRKWNYNAHVRRQFSVIHHLDLNRFPDIMMSLGQERTHVMVSCYCFRQGPIDASFQVNKSGYVPGEPVKFEINIKNQSQTPVHQYSVDLIQVTNYIGYNKTYSDGSPYNFADDKRFQLCCGSPDVPPNSTKQIQQTAIMPPLPPSILEGSRTIDIQYTITCRVFAGVDQLFLEVKTLIGTIPVREQMCQAAPQPAPCVSPNMVNISRPSLEPTAPPLDAPPPAYEAGLGPPPSYSECIFGRAEVNDDDDDEHTTRDASWAPAYPYYNWDQHTGNMQQQLTVQ